MVVVKKAKNNFCIFLFGRLVHTVDIVSEQKCISNVSGLSYTYLCILEPRLVEFGLVDRIDIDKSEYNI